MCTYIKTFSISYTCQMWRNFRFLHICHVEKFEITPHVEKFQIFPHLSCTKMWNFSTWQFFLHKHVGGVGDKYEICHWAEWKLTNWPQRWGPVKSSIKRANNSNNHIKRFQTALLTCGVLPDMVCHGKYMDMNF